MMTNIIPIAGTISNKTLKLVVDKLINIKDMDPINVVISSPGGDVYAGLAIYDALKLVPNKKIITIVGQAMSIATIVLLAGDERRATPNSRIMIHLPNISGNDMTTVDLRKEQKELEVLNRIMIGIYTKETSKPKSFWNKSIRDNTDTYYTLTEAKKIGLIHRVVRKLK